MSVKETIQINLKKLMIANSVKNADLAQVVGVSKTAVTYWLNGVNSINIEHMLIICNYFEVSIDEFLSHSSARPFDVNEVRLLDMYRMTGAEGKEDILAAARRSIASNEQGSSVASEQESGPKGKGVMCKDEAGFSMRMKATPRSACDSV